MGLAAEPIGGQPGPIVVELSDDQHLKVQQNLGGENGGYSVEEDQYQDENIVYDRVCVVCGKPVKVEQASVHLKVETDLKVKTEMISICCPLCYEVYQKRPDSFLALRALRAAQKSAIHPGNIEIDG